VADQGVELLGRLQTGSAIHLLAADHVHRYIFFHGEFEESTTRFLRSVARPGWTFLDVGANAGYFSVLALDLGGQRSSVHAFEPNPAMAKLLMRSARLNTPGIRVVESACGEQAGTASLHLSTETTNSGLSSLRPDVLPSSALRLEVSVVTLDGYCRENELRPDVIKIDVEGHEEQVLLGAESMLGGGVPCYVICELVPERAPAEDLLAVMSRHGYTACSIEDDGRLTALRPLPFQNVVFVRSEDEQAPRSGPGQEEEIGAGPGRAGHQWSQ
jgi:FkbM family methyltransferase